MGLTFLTGMAGIGKTCVGSLLAEYLGVPFIDLDQEIERASGRTIADIFSQMGEEEFRDYESVALGVAATLTDAVIALGAGTLVRNENFEIVQESGILIYLQGTLELLASRLASTGNRPLLFGATSPGELKPKLSHLLAEREFRYHCADEIIMIADRHKPEEIAAEIFRRLRK